ncbi:creatinase-like [Amphiura filiformis]|uniref:creatinase-like n=1 Tax=Amphiura filiformis TaxID=82378 RepID=UPI003B21E1D7
MLSTVCRLLQGRGQILSRQAAVPIHRKLSHHGHDKQQPGIVFHRLDGEERAQLMTIENGLKMNPTFSANEMNTRLSSLRNYMSKNGIEGALFTSYHNINYYADFMYCSWGRPYGLVVTHDDATTISALVDWAQPWRRANTCDNLIYTDWQRDNFWRAVQKLLGHVRARGKVGFESDHMPFDNVSKFKQAVPDSVDIVDIAKPAMELRIVKSDEEIALIREIATIADIGGAAQVEAMSECATEYEIVLHGTQAMVTGIAKKWPGTELRDSFSLFQTGINTDGCHNPPSDRVLKKGVISSINTFAMVSGYYAALERNTFLDHVPDDNLRIWEINCDVVRRGIELIKPGAKCKDITNELNEMYRQHGLLDARSFGYGHSFGIMCHYYGREAGEYRQHGL